MISHTNSFQYYKIFKSIVKYELKFFYIPRLTHVFIFNDYISYLSNLSLHDLNFMSLAIALEFVDGIPYIFRKQ